ncbi:MAG TPA: caspase family protein [Polyangiales bacterium]|nr:caspase family protein [Polyangiales bacterium]
MSRGTFLIVLQVLAVLAGARSARAEADGYAIVVGSNPGGPGQSMLRFAEDDASRVADVLLELGNYRADRIVRLLRPTPEQLLAAIERVRARVVPLAQSGKQSRFFFYYSGHARADALNLGSQELPLSTLRDRLLGLPATLSIVVLDACQSGAFSRVKGAGPATDFSFNSVDRLNTAGIAVIASSSAEELSQESEFLRSSFFTHHFLVGLRGAADRDGDGRVTLSEAYQYAYNHTLATTARTKVGEQHATLETNFKGKDDVPLTHPAAATARLRLGSGLASRVLVQQVPTWSVVAELDKIPGESVLLAVPAGSYAVTLRYAASAARCTVALRDGAETPLQPEQCESIPFEENESKGAAAASGSEGWSLEVGIGYGWGTGPDDYMQRLKDFELEQQERSSLRFQVSVGRRLLHNLAVGLEYFNLDAREYLRDLEFEQSFGWNAHGFGPYIQADVGLGSARTANLFARAGGGISVAWTTFDATTPENDFNSPNPSFQNTSTRTEPVTHHFVRPCAWLAGGVQWMPWLNFGFQFELRYTFAPGLSNEFGDVHNLGGITLTFGLRLRTWE